MGGEGGEELTRSGTRGRCSHNLQDDQHACLSVVSSNSLGPSSLACSAGVLFVRANAKSSRSFVRPAIIDLQLEWTVGVGGGGGDKIFTPLPPPLSLFLTVGRPLSINFYSPQPSAAIKIKDGGRNIRIGNHMISSAIWNK